jgi:cytoskeleton-associated protein 5
VLCLLGCALANICLPRTDVSDDIATALDHKVPTVQVETLTWLAGCVGNLDKPAAAKLDKALLLGTLRATEASTPAVRDAAFSVLAAAVRCGADLLHVHRAIDGMEAARKKRLQSFLADAANPEAAASSAAARPATAPSAPAAAAAPKAAAAPAGKLVASKPGPLSRSDSSGRAKGGAGTARAAPLDDENFDALELGGVSEDIAAAVDSLVGGGVVALLSNADWKQRLEAVTAAHTALAAVEPDALALHCDAITRQLGIAPGWEERMWQIVAKSFEILVLLAQKVPDFARASAMLAMGAVVSKIADPKLKTPAADVLTAWAEALGPRFITAQLYKRTATHKNPKVTELALGWMATAVEEFGGRVFDVRALINAAKECMSHTNPGVKAAAVRLLGAVHSAFGPAVKSYLTDFKPALLPALEAEFARCPHNPAAMDGVRRVKGAAPPPAAATSGASAAAGGGGGKPAVSVSASLGDGLPRDDISGLVTPQIIKDLSAPEWKVRQAALEALEAVIVAAGKRIGPNVGPDTMMSLKGRLADANKMLVIATLRMIGLMAEALGPGAADRVCRPIFQDMLKCWADQKKQARDNAAADYFSARTDCVCCLCPAARCARR